MGIKYDIFVRIRPDVFIIDDKINFKKCGNITHCDFEVENYTCLEPDKYFPIILFKHSSKILS